MNTVYRRNFTKYVFTLITTCVVVSFYIAAIKHDRDVHKTFHVKRLKMKRDVHHGKHRTAKMTPIKEPPHSYEYKNSSTKKGDSNNVHVFIVEEHHEVIPYWFAAARKEIIPKSGNTLVHIDGHSDLAAPMYILGYPVFTWPHGRELKFIMQANDVFIQAAAMTGLINRVIWVWPDWDKTNHDSDYFMSTVSLGFVSVIRKDRRTKKGFCACIKNGTNFECRTLTNVSRSAHKRDDDEGFVIPRNMCKIKKILIVEEIHEDKALTFFGKRDWIAKSENIILDIDEDYYGCGYAIQPLLKANLSYSKINQLDNLIASYICPTTFSQEKESDKFLMELLSVTRTKRACSIDESLIQSDRCKSVAKIDLHKHFRHQLNRSVTDNKLRMCPQRQVDDFVQHFLSKLVTFSIKQIRALQTTGFCLRTSTRTFRTRNYNNKFGVCIGSNTPKDTAILEHIPTQSEIATRSVLLKGLLKKLSGHSVRVVTVARSVRDGYTPRHLFEQIEGDVLKGLNVSFNKQLSIHYDRTLIGGKPGWAARHKA